MLMFSCQDSEILKYCIPRTWTEESENLVDLFGLLWYTAASTVGSCDPWAHDTREAGLSITRGSVLGCALEQAGERFRGFGGIRGRRLLAVL